MYDYPSHECMRESANTISFNANSKDVSSSFYRIEASSNSDFGWKALLWPNTREKQPCFLYRKMAATALSCIHECVCLRIREWANINFSTQVQNKKGFIISWGWPKTRANYGIKPLVIWKSQNGQPCALVHSRGVAEGFHHVDMIPDPNPPQLVVFLK